MKSSTNRALVAKKQSTFSAQVANNLLTLLQGYSKTIRLLLVMLLTLTVSANVWGQTWTRVTTMEQLTSGGTFIMGYEATAKSGTIVPLRSADCGATTNANGYFYTGTTASSSTNTTITMSSVVNTSAYELYISSPASGKINIQRATSTGDYYGASSGGSSKNTARLYTEGNTTETNLIVEWANQTNNQFKLSTGVSGEYKYLKYNTSSPRFAFYNSAGEKIVFYKKSAPSYTITATSNNNSYGTVSVSGTTITATPNAGYRVKSGDAGYTVTSGTADVTNNGDNTFSVTPSSNCTITINFEAIPKYTVTWNVNGEVYETTQVSEGSKPTFPATPSSCDATSNTFYGWATATWDGKINDVSAKTIYTSANDMPAVNGAVTYYAVFAEATTTGGGGGSTDVTIDLTDGTQVTTNSTDNLVFTEGDVTFTNTKVSGSTAANNYSPVSSTVRTSTRTYNGHRVTIAAGSTISKIVITAASTSYATAIQNATWTNGSATASSSTVTVTPSSGVSTVSFAPSATAGMTEVVVTTGGGGSTTYDNYITTCAAGDPCASLQAPNVTATATANSITLSWDAVDGAISYSVYNYTTEEAEEVNVLTYTFNGLDPETEYEWEVESVSATCNGKGTQGTTTTSATPCEQLGAATGLTVETDFVHTDGKTYVKFSWTPADNTKNYAASQKLCFGKVGEAGTCVDDLEKNKTWTGDLKSKLEPGEYWWSIQALGDGVNYCDGDVVNGTNFTIEAPTYTVEWFVNGEEAKGTPTTSVIAGQKVTVLPTTPTSADCDDNKVFVGWTDTEINGTSANAPTNLYKELGDFPAINANTIYYAVFATAEGNGGGGEGWTAVTSTSDLEAGATYAIRNAATEGTYLSTWEGGNNFPGSTSIICPLILGGSAGAWTFQIADGGTYNNRFLTATNTTEKNYLKAVTTADAYSVFTISFDANNKNAVITCTGKASRNILRYNANNGSPIFACYSSGQSPVYLQKYASATSYSDYSTTCVKLPDPVWNGATIDKTSLVVNCGGRSPMTGANGAAIISFPTEKIYNFTKDITIEATTGFLVSTSQTEDANYKSLVPLSPLVGTANANTFYDKHVYVRAEAPAMSEEDLSGTITIKNNKGETLQTFSVTADVTCTQYTLTLVDRGVSTEQSTKYYAGETIDEAPADPEGVCTDPIHYVFDGWAEATVAEGSTTYTKVTFPYTVTGNTKFYAVYRYLEGGGNGDYNLVTSALDDWSGDYLIAYSDQIFANGKIGGKEGIGAAGEKVDLSSYLNNNTIPAVEGDKYKVSLEAITDGYLLKTQDGQYNYQSSNTNGLEATTNKNTATTYKLSVNFVSSEEINLCLSGNALGAIFRYNTDQQGYFRFYKNGGQQPVYLYKKADGTTYYTTSPVCGPHLAITEGKDIYVTGGNAGGTRDLVIAQQKVSYKATRLQTSNGLDDGTAPDVKVATNGITVGGVVTSDVKVTIDQTKEQQTDGTYTITGTITVQYQPSANNKQEDIQVQLAVDYNAEARDNFTVHARSLPAEFVIVAKSGDKWYALNGDMNTNAANPANGQVTLDDDANPTKATFAPCNTIYTFDGLPNTGDRTYVRFQGTDDAWLWASSGTNVGIQNNVLKTTPEGSNKAYNWKLYTEDNITYRFGNANSSRQLTLNGAKFGMYASGVQDIRILPYVEKCLYNYAPSNLKVSVLKGTYVTLTWDAVPSATKYQYSTNGTTWTAAGTEPTLTINDLTGATEYTYYIRAYHEDAGVSQECIDYAEITFTTANCDDVPTDITYSADMNSIIVSWIADAATSTVNLYSDEEAEVLVATKSVASPCTFTDLAKNTQYYVQILADGTCASPIIPVKTEDVEVDVVEWDPQGIIVDINTDETVGVTLENEVSYGSGLGSLAEDLFFSKYFEGSGSLKMLAIYNGTGKDVDLSEYRIDRGSDGDATNISKTYDLSQLGVIKRGQEIIFYSWPLKSEDSYSCSQSFLDSKAQESGLDANPRWILCDAKTHNGIEFEAMDFSGNDPLLLYKSSELIDVFGVSTEQESPASTQICSGRSDKAWSADGVTNMDYGKTTEDFPNGEIPYGVNVDDETITAYTARVIMFRKNTVVSGKNAVTKNTTTFATFADEWEARQVCRSGNDGNLTCAAYQELGTFDYSDYYTKFVPMGEGSTFDENARNADGTVTIPITDLYKHACSNIRVKLTNSNSEVLSDREYKVPIMITSPQGTNGQAFLDLQQNLATKEVDGEGNVINTYPLSLDEVREICKTCDVVVRDNATLTKVTDGTTNDHPQVHDVIVYEGASIVIPDGDDHNYTINSLSLRRKGDEVASAQVQGTGKFVLPADAPVTLSMRIDANNWHWFTLPYDCDIAKVTWSDGTPAKYNTDWFLMYYDGESRAASTNPYDNHWKVYSGTTIEAGKGYIIGITGNLAHPNYTFELCFPMEQDVLTAEQTNKTVALNAWGVKSDNTPNNLGWNLVGNPYLNYYKTADGYSLAGLPLIHYTNTDPVTGEWNYENSGSVPYVVTPIDGGWYEYRQELASEVNMMPFTAYFVQVGDPNTHENGQALNASFEASNRGKKSILRRAPSEVDDLEEPAIVAISLTNAKGESDKTTLLIADRFTNEYEMNADFFKWFGDYYKYYTKPVLYTIGADQGKRAFNALNEELAAQPVALGLYAAQAGNYTFSLNQRAELYAVAEVWLHDANNNTYTNLMQEDYTTSIAKTDGAGRFSLSVKMMQKLPTDIENTKQGNVWATTQNDQIIVAGLAEDMQLWIYDATGKLLHADRTTNYQHSYSVSQTGTYFIRVQNTTNTQTIKVVVE